MITTALKQKVNKNNSYFIFLAVVTITIINCFNLVVILSKSLKQFASFLVTLKVLFSVLYDL